MFTFDSYACGIPCKIQVLDYQEPTAHSYFEEGDYEDAEWIVLDRRGRRATWLERKLQSNQLELERIHEEVIDECREEIKWHRQHDFDD